MGEIAIALLAAGRGSRMNHKQPKPLTPLQGNPLFYYALNAARESGLSPILTVVGYQADAVMKAIPPGVDIVFNPDWHNGISSSVQAALKALKAYPQVQAICIGLADQPLISKKSYQRLAQAYEQGATLAVATYGSGRCNPVLIADTLWANVMKLTGDQGVKQIMHTLTVTEVPCEDIGSPIDVDTLEDLNALIPDFTTTTPKSRKR